MHKRKSNVYSMLLSVENYSSKNDRFLFNQIILRFFVSSLVKKLHRHTNAHRQLVFDILGSKIGLSTHILVTRARSLLLNDYEPSMASISSNELKEKLKLEIHRSLEMHIQAHNQAIKFVSTVFLLTWIHRSNNCREWQQKMNENLSKEKNRGPRKNFRLYKTIK